MSIYFCTSCKKAFLPEATRTDGSKLYCKKCNAHLVNLGVENAQVSLKAHIESKYGNTTPKYHQFALIKSKHFHQPKHDQILIECEALLSENPLNTNALFTLCQWYYAKGYVNEALAIAEQILEIDPGFSAANEFIASKKTISSNSPKNLPKNIKTLENMAISYYNNQNFNQAIPILKKILTLDAKHAAAHRYLAEIYTSLEDYQSAISHFNYLTLIFPNDYRVFYNFAVLCYQINDFARAISNLNHAYNLCHDDPDFLASIQELIDHIQNK